MSSIDYSKWDKLARDLSDSEESSDSAGISATIEADFEPHICSHMQHLHSSGHVHSADCKHGSIPQMQKLEGVLPESVHSTLQQSLEEMGACLAGQSLFGLSSELQGSSTFRKIVKNKKSKKSPPQSRVGSPKYSIDYSKWDKYAAELSDSEGSITFADDSILSTEGDGVGIASAGPKVGATSSSFLPRSSRLSTKKNIRREKQKKRGLAKVKKASGSRTVSPLVSSHDNNEIKLPFSQGAPSTGECPANSPVIDLGMDRTPLDVVLPAQYGESEKARPSVGSEAAACAASAGQSLRSSASDAGRKQQVFVDEAVGIEEPSNKSGSAFSTSFETPKRRANTSSLGSVEELEELGRTVLTWKVTEFTHRALKEDPPLFSNVHTDDLGCSWRFILYPRGEKVDDWVSVFIEVPDSDKLPFGWKRDASFTITLSDLSGKNSQESYSRSDSHVFKSTGGDTSWGWPNFIECARLAADGFCVDDCVEIKAEITLHSMSTEIAQHDLSGYLCSACSSGNAANVDYCLQRGAQVNYLYKSNAPLHSVCMATKANTQVLKLLLESEADINLVNGDVETGLLLAAYYGHVSIMKALLAKGAEPEIGPTKNGLCCVGAAAQQGELEALKVLLDAGAPIEGLGAGCCVPLKQALQLKKWECAKQLIKSGCRTHPYSEHDEDYIIFVARHGPADVLFCLADSGVDPNVVDKTGESPLSILLFQRNMPDLAYHFWREYGASVGRCSRDRKKVQRAKLLLTLEHKKSCGADVRDAAFEFIASQLSEDCLPILKMLESKKISISQQAAQFVKNRLQGKEDLPHFLFEDPSYKELFEDTDLREFGLDPEKLQRVSDEFISNRIAERVAKAEEYARELIQEEEAEMNKKENQAKKKKKKKKKKKAKQQAKRAEEDRLQQLRRQVELRLEEKQNERVKLEHKTERLREEKSVLLQKKIELEKERESLKVQLVKEKTRKKDKHKIKMTPPEQKEPTVSGKRLVMKKNKEFAGKVTKLFGGSNGYLFVNYKVYCSREVVEASKEHWPPNEGDEVSVTASWDPVRENWRAIGFRLIKSIVPEPEPPAPFNDFYAAATAFERLVNSVGGKVCYSHSAVSELLASGSKQDRTLVDTAMKASANGLKGLLERFPDRVTLGQDENGTVCAFSKSYLETKQKQQQQQQQQQRQQQQQCYSSFETPVQYDYVSAVTDKAPFPPVESAFQLPEVLPEVMSDVLPAVLPDVLPEQTFSMDSAEDALGVAATLPSLNPLAADFEAKTTSTSNGSRLSIFKNLHEDTATKEEVLPPPGIPAKQSSFLNSFEPPSSWSGALESMLWPRNNSSFNSADKDPFSEQSGLY